MRQLRLRDIGGIIVVDFIDMMDSRNSKGVRHHEGRVAQRPCKIQHSPSLDFGVMQITRERIRPSLMQRMGDQCPACGGSGVVQARFTTINQIERWLRKYALQQSMKFQQLDLYVSPTVIEPLQNSDMKTEMKWFLQHLLFVRVKEDESLRSDDFRFYSRKTAKTLLPNTAIYK